MGLLSGVTALIAKHLIISPKMGLFYCAKPLKMGEMWCVLVGLGAKISKFSANFQQIFSWTYGKISFSLRCS